MENKKENMETMRSYKFRIYPDHARAAGCRAATNKRQHRKGVGKNLCGKLFNVEFYEQKSSRIIEILSLLIEKDGFDVPSLKAKYGQDSTAYKQ